MGNVMQLAWAAAHGDARGDLTLEEVWAAEARLMRYLRYTPVLQTWLTTRAAPRVRFL